MEENTSNVNTSAAGSGSSSGSGDNVTLSKDTLYGSIIAVLVGLLVLSVFTQGFGLVKGQGACELPAAPADNSGTSGNVQPSTQPDTSGTDTADAQPSAPEGLPVLTVTPGALPAQGSASAEVIMVEFSDYQCPFCSKFYNEGEHSVVTNYVDSGKVKFYYADFPLSFHPNALPGAMAARCANEQGKFWEMHDKLFDAQSSWSALSDPGDTFKGYAGELGLDSAEFTACYDGGELLSAINDDFVEGKNSGVQGTPTSFLIIPKSKISQADITGAVAVLNAQYGNGIGLFENDDEYTVMVPGAYPYDTFETVLKAVNY